MAELTIRAGRTIRLGRLRIGLWLPRFWTLGVRLCSESSYLSLALGPISIRIAR